MSNGLSILQHQSARERHPLTPCVVAAWNHEQHIGSQVAQLTFSEILGTTPNANKRDHGRIADHNPEHGQQAAQPVGLQGVEGHADGFGDGQIARHG